MTMLLSGSWWDQMAGHKYKPAVKPVCEAKVIHIDGSVCFWVFVGQSESEQIPTSEGNPNASPNGKSGEHHFTFLLQACDTNFYGRSKLRQGIHVSRPLGHQIPALFQGVGRQI